jgi:hypothetical protein
MHPEIENLINMALANDDLSQKEKEIILRKAESLGEDRDEVELILDGKFSLLKKEKSKTISITPSKSEKAGVLIKCPSCGAPAESFTAICTSCNYEFRNKEASISVNAFYQKLQDIVSEETGRKIESYGLEKLFSSSARTQMIVDKNITQRQVALISSFPVPNSKEDILEFLTMAIPEATKKLGCLSSFPGTIYYHKKELKDAYKAKCKQIIMKAKISLKEDKETLSQIDYYELLLKGKK